MLLILLTASVIINEIAWMGTEISANDETVPRVSMEKGVRPGSDPTTGIVFNEILPSPDGSDQENEWIEIFNQNNFEFDLSDWKIRDIVGSIKTYAFPKGSKISPLAYLVLQRPETKITLNNSGDGLELINPNGEVVDSVTFKKAPLGQSYNKTQSSWVWSTILTPGGENVIPSPQPKAPEPQKVEVGPRLSEKTTAALGEKIINLLPGKSTSRSFVPFFVALVIAIFSAGIILFLKKTAKN